MGGLLLDLGDELRLDYYTEPAVMRYTHVHPQYELYFCPSAIEQTSVINGTAHRCSSPCAILSTPYTIHSMSCEESAREYERYVLYFSEKTLSAFAPRLLPFSLGQRSAGLFFELTEDAATQLLQTVKRTKQTDAVAERELLLVLLLNQLSSICRPDRILEVGGSHFYVQDVLQYIVEHFSEPIEYSELLRRFGVSRSKLDRDFKQITGITVHQFVELCRLNHAKYLLQFKKEFSIRRVCEACGFTGENYFFPFFKKHTGMTPAEYRQQYIQPTDK